MFCYFFCCCEKWDELFTSTLNQRRKHTSCVAVALHENWMNGKWMAYKVSDRFVFRYCFARAHWIATAHIISWVLNRIVVIDLCNATDCCCCLLYILHYNRIRGLLILWFLTMDCVIAIRLIAFHSIESVFLTTFIGVIWLRLNGWFRYRKNTQLSLVRLLTQSLAIFDNITVTN